MYYIKERRPKKPVFFGRYLPNVVGWGGWFPNKVQTPQNPPKSPRKSPFSTRSSPFVLPNLTPILGEKWNKIHHFLKQESRKVEEGQISWGWLRHNVVRQAFCPANPCCPLGNASCEDEFVFWTQCVLILVAGCLGNIVILCQEEASAHWNIEM